MKISMKRNVACGLVLVVITCIVLYSYCDGSCSCYTFPFFNDLEQCSAAKQVMVMSTPHGGRVIIEKGINHDIDRASTLESSPEVNTAREGTHTVSKTVLALQDNVTNMEHERLTTATKTGPHFKGIVETNQGGSNQSTPSRAAPRHRVDPPFDITGAVADEILRNAHVSKNNVNRSLRRVERVDQELEETLDHLYHRGDRTAQDSSVEPNEKGSSGEKRLGPAEDEDVTRNLPVGKKNRASAETTRSFYDSLLMRDKSGEKPLIILPGKGLEEDPKVPESVNLSRIIGEIQQSGSSADVQASGNFLSTVENSTLASLNEIGSALYNLKEVLGQLTDSKFSGHGSGHKEDKLHFQGDVPRSDRGRGIHVVKISGRPKRFHRKTSKTNAVKNWKRRDSREASKKIRFVPHARNEVSVGGRHFPGNSGMSKGEKEIWDSSSRVRPRDGTRALSSETRVRKSSEHDRSPDSDGIGLLEAGPRKGGLMTFHRVDCAPLDPHVLLFNRIFKTGSSTTELLMKKSSRPMNYEYHTGTTEDWFEGGKRYSYSDLIKRTTKKKLQHGPRMAFIGHFYFRNKMDIPQAHTYISQVREPVRRVVSHYYYMRSQIRPAERMRTFWKSADKNDTLERCFQLQHRGCQSNVMTKFFCGRHDYCGSGSEKALRKAKANIKRHYAVVGLLEHFPSYLQVLGKRLPRFFSGTSEPVRIVKQNREYRFDRVPGWVLDNIRKANWADEQLYAFIKRRFFRQARLCGVSVP